MPRGASKGRRRRGARTLPHDGVYVRLQPSKIHGLGVFAIRSIPKGAQVFGDSREDITRVPVSIVRRLRDGSRHLYEDFCAVEDGDYITPRSFNELTISWYMNHGDDPNVQYDEKLTFVAARRIRRGEELTADYRTYCEDPFPWRRKGRRARRR